MAVLVFFSPSSEKDSVRFNKDRLRAQCLPDGAVCSYAKVTVDDRLAGNVFACRWPYNDKTVCWITQLVVNRDYRERGFALGLLNQLRQGEDDIYGLMSSHPAACLAAAKAFGGKTQSIHSLDIVFTFRLYVLINVLTGSIETLQLGFIREHAEDILKSSPVDYVKTATPRGTLFDTNDTNGLVSSVYSRFFVDHTEPLEVLARVREELNWPLGELLDGYEFLIIIEDRRRARLRLDRTHHR